MRPKRPDPTPSDSSLAAQPDDRLLTAAADGDERAFEAIVTRYHAPLTRYCSRILRAERVDDAVQHAFLAAWLALERGVPVRALRPWLYSITHNAAIDQLRLHRRSDTAELPDDLPGGLDPATVSADQRLMHETLDAVANLPEPQRTALVDTAVHGRSVDAVADDLGVSGGALRQMVHRARTTIRGAVTSLGAGPPAARPQVGADGAGDPAPAPVSGTGEGRQHGPAGPGAPASPRDGAEPLNTLDSECPPDVSPGEPAG